MKVQTGGQDTQHKSLQFRNDVNGLRAFAVLAVVLYHFDVSGFYAGFAGVDIFFVISGFLMTSIIVDAIERRAFSFYRFYIARARRIIPALSVMSLLLLILGYFALTPLDYRTLGEHTAGAITFVSNFIFKGEEGYFDAPMRDKWMLHTWSLSVEWQFYIIYPVALYLASKATKKLPWALGIAAAASLLASIFLSETKSAFSFYLLPCRVWEFLVGASIWYASRKFQYAGKKSRVFELLGLSLIAATCFVFDSEVTWPGLAATVPVAGAALVILAHVQDSLFTNNPIMRHLGRWSYSIYLWHWPLNVGLAYYQFNSDGAKLLAIAASIILGALSFYFVEQPFRTQKSFSKICLLGLVAIPFALGLTIFGGGGFSSRVPVQVARIEAASQNKYEAEQGCGYKKDKREVVRCNLGREGGLRFILWGDSHAGAIATAVTEASGQRGLIYSNNCPTIFNAYPKVKSKNICAGFNEAVYADVSRLPPQLPVIISNRFSFYLWGTNEGIRRINGLAYGDVSKEDAAKDEVGTFKRKLVESLCKIAGTRETYVLQPIPEMGRDVPKTISRGMMARGTHIEDVTISREKYNSRNKEVIEALHDAETACGIKLLDPLPYLCDNEKCFGSQNLEPIYFDDDHLNEWGNKRLVPLFAKIFQ